MIRLQTAERSIENDQVFLPPPQATPHVRRQFDDLLDEIAEAVAPVWPLQDYVAVNPYAGIAERPFMDARRFLRLFSDCETLMPLSYYDKLFATEQISRADIEAAIDELGLGDSFNVANVIEQMQSATTETSGGYQHRAVRTIAEYVDTSSSIQWSETIVDEVSKFCAAHYDEGQAVWASPWKEMPLFQAWRSAAMIDRNIEILGLSGFRSFVTELPHTADAAIVWLLTRLGVPESLWKPFLLCQAYSLPGWSAWAKYQSSWTDETSEQTDLTDLLAIRLAYDVALSGELGIGIDWNSICHNESASFDAATDNEATCRYLLLRASEIAFRDSLLESIVSDEAVEIESDRQLAQMVFCIDVRSERIRRHLESQTSGIETFGFAGFFGMPIEFVPIGQSQGNSHVPVLLKTEFQLHEGLHETKSTRESAAMKRRSQARSWRKSWKDFQRSAVGCFSFVETTGLLYAWKLLSRAVGRKGPTSDSRYDGIESSDHKHLGPTLRGLNHQGITTSHQVDLAASMLTNLGLTDNFARLVAFCGHTSQTENNPLAAGLDCGACGGHSGEPNARLAALLLNQKYIRSALAERGIKIPDDTYFLGGLHNTTTDRIEFFDLDEVPESHRTDVQELIDHTLATSKQTKIERMPIVASDSIADVMRRAVDWSEVRPEWGLAGNAAFIVGPRTMTKNVDLEGRSFLHSYDHQNDPDGAVLETIMTAPMVVAHWINMQYYASVIDNTHFGSGNKTVHNVVGQFGILSGNGGDLQTGLPWQSLHTGEDFQHLPLRLQSVIAAPRESIDQVIQKHEMVANLLNNGWLHLVAIEDGVAYRYAEGRWNAGSIADSVCLQKQ